MADRPVDRTVSVTLLEQCAGLLPDDAELLADLGAAYGAAGLADQAEAAYRRALDRDPDYADVHVRLARLLLQRHATTEARAHAQSALRLLPNRQAVIELLADLAQSGDGETP